MAKMGISQLLFVAAVFLICVALGEAACGLTGEYGKENSVCYGTGTEQCRKLATSLSGEYDCKQYSIRGWKCVYKGSGDCKSQEKNFSKLCKQAKGTPEVKQTCPK
ncbi:uncharacterized protein VTP21DRAFT_6884 [Calcarisporiella thermophila]|uniref:uncharacterized protein n=1 Tax=Calcarisporiella thermophila TaxID=911321 RepID=UPI0037431385